MWTCGQASVVVYDLLGDCAPYSSGLIGGFGCRASEVRTERRNIPSQLGALTTFNSTGPVAYHVGSLLILGGAAATASNYHAGLSATLLRKVLPMTHPQHKLGNSRCNAFCRWACQLLSASPWYPVVCKSCGMTCYPCQAKEVGITSTMPKEPKMQAGEPNNWANVLLGISMPSVVAFLHVTIGRQPEATAEATAAGTTCTLHSFLFCLPTYIYLESQVANTRPLRLKVPSSSRQVVSRSPYLQATGFPDVFFVGGA